jgi:hypothetical protein
MKMPAVLYAAGTSYLVLVGGGATSTTSMETRGSKPGFRHKALHTYYLTYFQISYKITKTNTSLLHPFPK